MILLLYSFVPHWTLGTTLLYSLMGLVGVWSIIMATKQPYSKPFYKNKYYQIWFSIWILVASFRLIDGGAGGTDAGAYYLYFIKCFDIRGWELTPLGLYDSNLGFRWYNRILKFISDNQIYYLFITHGIMLLCVIKFIDVFKFRRVSFVPFFLIVFWYLRGFCTIRSNFATAILLVSLIFLAQDKYKQSIVVAIISILFHKMMLLYALFIPFYWYAKKKKVTVKMVLVGIVTVSLITTAITNFIFGGNLMGDEFTEHYGEYSEKASEVGFFGNFWKIAFEQIVLGVLMVSVKKKFMTYRASFSDKLIIMKLDIIWYACLFDMLLLPICSAFGIWRGYEVFYVPRLVMWSIILGILKPKSTKFQFLYTLLICCIFYGWFWQRLSAKSFWYETNLMPYLLNIQL